MAGNHSSTTNHNKVVLIYELSLKQISNTSAFRNDKFFVLSPSVQNQYKWFDLRKVNLSRYNKNKEKGYLLIRLFNEFLLADLDDFIDKMITDDTFVETKNSGIHWKFLIDNSDTDNIIVINQRGRNQYIVNKVSVEDLNKVFKS